MTNNEEFIPPFPTPHKSKASFVKRFFTSWNCWVSTLFERSYTMKMGEVKLFSSFYIVNELPLVNKILKDREGRFPKSKLLKYMLYPLIGNSVFSATEDDWNNQRKMTNPAFAHANLKRVFPTMQAASERMLEIISERDMDKLHVDPVMTYVAADIILRTILSTELTDESAKTIHDAFHSFQKYAQRSSILKIYGLPSFGNEKKSEKYAAEIKEIFNPIIRKRYDEFHADIKAGGEHNRDILDSLLQAKHPETDEYFTFEELSNQIATIFLAGHETSASALTWTLYLIAKCPHFQERIYQEIKDVSGDKPIEFEHIKQLEMARSAFQESLRLYPPVSFILRENKVETTMRKKIMKAGSMVVVSPWLLQRNKNYWNEPHTFKPCRFAAGADEKDVCKDAYIPFGKGSRICIGAGFAGQESVLIIATILREFKISIIEGLEPKPISRVTTRPKDGLFLKFEKRG